MRETGFIGSIEDYLSLASPVKPWGSQCRIYNGIRSQNRTEPERGSRVAAGLRRGATRVRRGCYAVATTRKCRNRVAVGKGGGTRTCCVRSRSGSKLDLFSRVLILANGTLDPQTSRLPPSMCSTVPVTKPLPMRNMAPSAMSSGVPILPTGKRAASSLTASSRPSP